ncbi:peptidoglycan-binding protein [Streptomyces sp. NPDC004520]|uniref:peptidoglycan-binding domain-containing protein n=1 Tax=Streptomyces sp. NPDC004520 TaxID=3364702 RepID=UPI0036A9B179
MADVEIYWTGLECQVKQETPDDQIYGSIQVIAATAPLPAIPFPDEKWVSLGPEGQRIYAPNQLIYSGNLKPITVAATLAESDSGDCEDEKRAVSGALSDAARSALNGYIPGAGEMSKKVLDLLAKSVVNYFADDVLGVGDDVYNPQGIALDEEALVTANARRQMLRRDDDPHSLQWTDVIVLSGTDDGGDYGQYGIYLDVRPSKAAVLAHSISKHAAKDLSKLPGQTLQLGSSGPDVSRLQQLLNQKISDLAPLTVDGAFGAVTAARVREFQHRAGITVDGVVGPQTWGILQIP